MKLKIFCICLFMVLCSRSFSQDLETVMNEVYNGLDNLSESEDQQNYQFTLNKMKETYKDLNKFYCVTDFKIYRENCKFI